MEKDKFRYKKNYSIDGWPVEDTENGVVLSNDDICETLNTYHCLLLLALYHAQGGKSEVGQPIRSVLGIGQFDDLTDDQISKAKAASKFV